MSAAHVSIRGFAVLITLGAVIGTTGCDAVEAAAGKVSDCRKLRTELGKDFEVRVDREASSSTVILATEKTLDDATRLATIETVRRTVPDARVEILPVGNAKPGTRSFTFAIGGGNDEFKLRSDNGATVSNCVSSTHFKGELQAFRAGTQFDEQ